MTERMKKNERGVSTVVGIALIVLFTVILAGGLFVFAFDISNLVSTPPPQSSFTANNGEIVHNGGDPIPPENIEIEGGIQNPSNTPYQSGDVIAEGVSSGTQVIWNDPDSETTQILYVVSSTESVNPDDVEAPDDLEEILEQMDGEGTQENPYIITNINELQATQADLEAHYKLGNDIDGSETAGWNDGDGFDPIGNIGAETDEFQGSFDGDGHTIFNLYIDRGGSENPVGLFSVAYDTEIKNVTIVNAEVHGNSSVGILSGVTEDTTISDAASEGTVTGEVRVGGLIGRHNGTVTDSISTADVTADGQRAGGLIGSNSEGDIINSSASGSVTGEDDVGGLVGGMPFDGTVEHSLATGSATADNGTAGGLIGFSNGLTTDSYATTTTTGNEAGGLVGFNAAGSTVSTSYATGSVNGNSSGGLIAINNADVEDSYWDTDQTNEDRSDGGTPLTTDEMQGSNAENNMDGFDFTATWTTVDGGYPELQHQHEDENDDPDE